MPVLSCRAAAAAAATVVHRDHARGVRLVYLVHSHNEGRRSCLLTLLPLELRTCVRSCSTIFVSPCFAFPPRRSDDTEQSMSRPPPSGSPPRLSRAAPPPSTRARARTRAFSSFSWGPLRSPTTDHPPPHAQDHGTHTARFRHAGWARGCCLYLCLPAFPPANRMDGGRATSGKAPGASPPYHYVLECRSRSGGGTGTGAGRVGLGVTCDRGRFGRGP